MTEPEQPVVAQPLRAALKVALDRMAFYMNASRSGEGVADEVVDEDRDFVVEARAALAVEAVRPEYETFVAGDGELALRVRAVRPETDIDESLDAAWSEVEAALPEGWRLTVQRTDEDFAVWSAAAVGPAFFEGEADDDWIDGLGPTPTAALRSLTEKLRATPLAERPE